MVDPVKWAETDGDETTKDGSRVGSAAACVHSTATFTEWLRWLGAAEVWFRRRCNSTLSTRSGHGHVGAQSLQGLVDECQHLDL